VEVTVTFKSGGNSLLTVVVTVNIRFIK